MSKFWKKFLSNRWSLPIIIILSVLLILIIGGLVLQKLYENRIYPGVQIGQIDLTGKTKEEAQYYIQEEANSLKDGLVFYYKDKELAVGSTITSFDIDLSQQIFTIDSYKTAERAFLFGRSFNFLANFKNKFFSLIFKKQLGLDVKVNQEKLKELLKDSFDELTVPVQEAGLVKDDKGNFFISLEQPGVGLDYDQAIAEFTNDLINISAKPIALEAKIIKPKILKQNALNIDNQAKQILALTPLKLKYGDKSWSVEEAVVSDWLILSLEQSKKEVIVSLDQDSINKYLKDEIAPELDQPVVEAKFKMSNNKVSVFQSGQDGWQINTKASALAIARAIQDGQREIFLTVENTKAVNDLQEATQLGITELIGAGVSNFAGSPANRRHNIKVGAETLNGLLIKPGEEFSILKALGEINSETGYLEELVIKGNKTIAEYGGGLCQVSTTLFRAVLAAGLPVTMRSNHSYRVSYYEPAGTDATIYDPWPDFRFINDYDSYLLIQTRIEGDNLIFEFWGTKDGRTIEQTKPVLYNITEPEPSKIVETTELPVGQKKCTERAHNGADAWFDYNVTYASGEIKKERFYSHYVPWQEVCLIGVKELSSEQTGIGVYEKNTTKIKKE